MEYQINKEYQQLHNIVDKVSKKLKISFKNALTVCCYSTITVLEVSYWSLSGKKTYKEDAGEFYDVKSNVQKYLYDAEIMRLVASFSSSYLGLLAVQGPFSNILGKIIDEGLLNTKLGQFFTPDDLADSLAEIFSVVKEKKGSDSDVINSISEITCGVGSLVLSQLRWLFENDNQLLSKTYIHINELDFDYCYIASFQIRASVFVFQTANPLGLNCHAGDTISEYITEKEINTSKILFDAKVADRFSALQKFEDTMRDYLIRS